MTPALTLSPLVLAVNLVFLYDLNSKNVLLLNSTWLYPLHSWREEYGQRSSLTVDVFFFFWPFWKDGITDLLAIVNYPSTQICPPANSPPLSKHNTYTKFVFRNRLLISNKFVIWFHTCKKYPRFQKCIVHAPAKLMFGHILVCLDQKLSKTCLIERSLH